MGRVDLIIGKCRSMAIAVIQNEYRMFYGEKKFDKKNLENKKKIDAGQKNDARGDDKLMFFLTRLTSENNVLLILIWQKITR